MNNENNEKQGAPANAASLEIEQLKKQIEELKQKLYLEQQKNQKLLWLIGLTNSNGLMDKIEKK